MFSVPGWAVSASTLVQETPRSKQVHADTENTNPGKSSKKRRHNDEFTTNNDTNHKKTRKDARDRDAARYKDARASRLAVGVFEASNQEPVISRPLAKPKKLNKAPKAGNPSKEGNDLETDQRTNPHEASKKTQEVSDLKSPLVTNGLTPLQVKMRSKLTSARFRHLNETLYTTSSSDALQLFTNSPELFADYHAGFAQQVKDSWPQNPVNEYIKMIKVRGALSESKSTQIPLPRRKTGSCTVADLGCGDAQLARGCQAVMKSLRLKFHNYDLHAPNSLVTKADISDLPLRDGEADIAVFCLSLMGINWINFVEEAWRVLRGDGKGEIWVAEVKSRFGRVTKGRVVDNSVGKRRKKSRSQNADDDDEFDGAEQFEQDQRAENEDETDTSAFIKVFTRRGFQLRENSLNRRNKMFVSMIFTKTGIPTAGKYQGLKWNGKEYSKQQDGKTKFGRAQTSEEVTPAEEAKVLKPCVYKTR